MPGLDLTWQQLLDYYISMSSPEQTGCVIYHLYWLEMWSKISNYNSCFLYNCSNSSSKTLILCLITVPLKEIRGMTDPQILNQIFRKRLIDYRKSLIVHFQTSTFHLYFIIYVVLDSKCWYLMTRHKLEFLIWSWAGPINKTCFLCRGKSEITGGR